MNDIPKHADLLSDEPSNRGSGEQFLIVGIGASAGGIYALKQFFAHVPADSDIAYVVILHLSPNHDSKLAEVLQTATAIPVKQVKESVKVEPNNVYVISPNKSLEITDGHLMLSDATLIEQRRAPVDIFFRTLAESRHSSAISVILSGTGANGSMGIKRVKELGGIALVQEPAEAEYPEMPRNSIATGLVDYILPVALIPAKIIAYKQHLGSVNIPVEPRDRAEEDDQALREIFTLLRVRTGHDFSNYKRSTILRRIERRISVHELSDLPTYARFLQERNDEARALLKDLLISVTNFFRDKEAFAALEHTLIPKLFENKTPGDDVRVWIAGCATGEEAYSVAMLLGEFASKLVDPPLIQVFATDIDEWAVSKARDGYYTLNDAADVSPERLRRFFYKEDDLYRVRRELREMVLFAKHNVIKDPPFSHLDLISCRNLMIYLNRTAQSRLLELLHFALNPNGYLFLGTSESIDGSSNLFITADKDHHIFYSRPIESRIPLPIPQVSVPQPLPYNQIDGSPSPAERFSYLDLHLRLLEEYGPPSVVVNEEYNVLHLSDRAGRYMQLQGGEPSNNLLKLVRPEIRLELRAALYQATQNRKTYAVRGTGVNIEGKEELVDIIVRPILRDDDGARGLILVLFEQADIASGSDTRTATLISTNEPIARQLEEQLMRVKSQLRAASEQSELQTEELKASNEELQAMNEELRSSTEELETSKEELQSLNEELTTVNQELKIKIEELTESNNDIQNFINSTDIGTIFLDRLMRVKLFTPRSQDIFNLIPTDVGRELSHITNKLSDGRLIQDIQNVINNLHPIQREVKTQAGRWYLLRVVPYRTSEQRGDGVILTFVEITDRLLAEARDRDSQAYFNMIKEVADFAIIFMDSNGIIQSWNLGAEIMFGHTNEEAVGQTGAIIFTPEDRANGVFDREMRRALKAGSARDERWHIRKDTSRFFVSGVLSRVGEGSETGYVKIARDLTQQKDAEERLHEAHERLETTVNERTRELASANEALHSEIAERIQAEKLRIRLLRQIVRAQEDERRRIARDIHDQLGQQTTALRLKLEAIQELCRDKRELCNQIEQSQEIAAELDRGVDFLAWELRPAALDDLGLQAAVSEYVKEWSQFSGVAAEFHSSGFDDARLGTEIETNLYRITQEALGNTMKHGQAKRASVLLERRDDHVVLIIEDDGVGFDPLKEQDGNERRLGLTGMRERASQIGGSVEVESKPDEGTTVFARVPLPFEEEDQ